MMASSADKHKLLLSDELQQHAAIQSVSGGDATFPVNNGIVGAPTFTGIFPYASPPDATQDDKPGTEAGLLTRTVYRRRWYILTLFIVLTTVQNMIWNTWGPLADSMKRAYDWGDGTVALQTNWGPIAYVITLVPCVWLMDVKGMRWACVITAFLMSVGAGLRCITTQTHTFTWLVHVGQILNGVGGPVTYGGPPVLSACWFPSSQRTTATALGTLGNGLGMALAFTLGPLLVPDARNHGNSTISNATMDNLIFAADGVEYLRVGNHSHASKEGIKNDIQRLMYIECGMAVFIFVLLLAYFPAKPPSPPSRSASTPRVEFVAGMKQLMVNKRFWMLAIAFSVSVGVNNGWITVLYLNLSPLGVSQDNAGWMGFAGVLAGYSSGILFSRCADVFSRHMRVFLLGLFSVAVAMFLVFALIVDKVIPYNLPVLFATMITGNICVAGATPLFFELVCEATYPVAEGITNGFLTWLSAIFTTAYLLILMFPQSGVVWINWVMLGSVSLCVPIFCFYKEKYNRLDVDTGR